MSTASSSSYRYVPESETTVYYPKSKRKVKLNHKGEIIEDTRADKRVIEVVGKMVLIFP